MFLLFILASNGEYWRLLSNGVYEIWAVSQENRESNKAIIESSAPTNYQTSINSSEIVVDATDIKNVPDSNLFS